MKPKRFARFLALPAAMVILWAAVHAATVSKSPALKDGPPCFPGVGCPVK